MNLDALVEKFAGSVGEPQVVLDETTIVVKRESILPVCLYLRDAREYAFDFLTDLCGVDLHPAAPRFQVVYHLCSLGHGLRLRIKVPVPEEDPEIDSVVPVWETADWLERECFDMFGIRFRGHPDLTRILTPEGFEGHPLRKDYPLEGTVAP